MKQIIMDGILVELEKKKIKNMYLKVMPPDGRVHISAPQRMKEEFIEQFVISRKEWIKKSQIRMQQRHINTQSEYISNDEIIQLKKELPFLIAKWEKIIGVQSSGFCIRDMKTRWGTCNVRTRNICFNLQLAKKPVQCLEYVVVHELVHLLERSHNSVFKSYMDQFLPQWRSIKKELNGL